MFETVDKLIMQHPLTTAIVCIVFTVIISATYSTHYLHKRIKRIERTFAAYFERWEEKTDSFYNRFDKMKEEIRALQKRK